LTQLRRWPFTQLGAVLAVQALQLVLPGLQPLAPQSWLPKVPLLQLWMSPFTHCARFGTGLRWQPLALQLSLVHWLPSSQLMGVPERPLLQGVN